MAANFKLFYRTFFPLESYMLCFEQSINNYTVISSFTDILIISEVFSYMQIIYQWKNSFWKLMLEACECGALYYYTTVKHVPLLWKTLQNRGTNEKISKCNYPNAMYSYI